MFQRGVIWASSCQVQNRSYFWKVDLGKVLHFLNNHKWIINQGHLKKWTGHSSLILPNPKPLEISSPKFQHFNNYEKYDFSPNLKGVAQKLAPPRPWEFFYVFGGKSKFWAPMTLIFCAKRIFIEVENWWKFGVDISIHFWEIKY